MLIIRRGGGGKYEMHRSAQFHPDDVCIHTWVVKIWQRRLAQGGAGPSEYHPGRRFSGTGTQSLQDKVELLF